MSQILLEPRQPEPLEILVENVPVKEGHYISENFELNTQTEFPELKWKDIAGLSWVFLDPYLILFRINYEGEIISNLIKKF